MDALLRDLEGDLELARRQAGGDAVYRRWHPQPVFPRGHLPPAGEHRFAAAVVPRAGSHHGGQSRQRRGRQVRRAFRAAGINRLSLGIQSFDDACLQALGRVHNSDQARAAIEYARAAGFASFNIDLMHGLPGQTRGRRRDGFAHGARLQPRPTCPGTS